MIKILELAISKVAALPEAAQEQLGREILERVDTLSGLRTEVEAGIAELDAGLGVPLDVEEVVADQAIQVVRVLHERRDFSTILTKTQS